MADLSRRSGLRMLVAFIAGVIVVICVRTCRTPSRPADRATTGSGTGAMAPRSTERPHLEGTDRPGTVGTANATAGSSAGSAASSAGSSGIATSASDAGADTGSARPPGMKAQLRAQVQSVDAEIRDCVKQSVARGTRHTGRTTLTFIAGRDKDGTIGVESTGDDDDESTVKDDALASCLHPLAKPFAVRIDDDVDYVAVNWYVDLKDGEVTYTGVSSYTNRRPGEAPTD